MVIIELWLGTYNGRGPNQQTEQIGYTNVEIESLISLVCKRTWKK